MAPRLKNLKVPKHRGGNLDEEITRITTFTRNYVNEAGARGVVIGMSGGVDSAVVSFLSVKALGAKRVTALLLFEDEFKKGKDYKDAERLISKIKIERVEFDITRVIDAFQNAFLNWGFKTSKVSLANVKARVRMTLLYLVANERKLLVIGTGDRSEESIGYFTKYGDGGVDFMPIAHLYKTEVKALARKLGVPRNIIEKPSSPNLWKGHTATDELPVDYPFLDKILKLLLDRKKSEASASKLSGVSLKTVREVVRRHKYSEHKRKYPPMISG